MMDAGLATVAASSIAAAAAVWSTWITRRQQPKLAEIHRQVNENHHSNERPTVLDRLDDVEKRVEDHTAAVSDLSGKVDRLTKAIGLR